MKTFLIRPMKNILCLIALATSASFVFSGCQSTNSLTSNALPDEPMYQPVPEREPVFTGDYFEPKEVDTLPSPAGTGLRESPVYPVDFKRRRVTGEAVIAFMVTANGRTEQIQIRRATHRGFGDAAMEAVRQWRFNPATKDGKPVNVVMSLPIAFSLVDT